MDVFAVRLTVFNDESAFEFDKSADHVKDQDALCRRRIDRF